MRPLLIATLMSIAGASVALLSGASVVKAQDDAEARCWQVRPGFVQCTERRIEGSAPQSYFVLGRSPMRYEAAPLSRESMASEVVRTVRRTPF